MFLDRDGVLNEVVWRGGRPASPRTAAELTVVAGAAEAVARLRAAGLRVFVVSNQPDVARGLLPPDGLAAITAALQERVAVDDVAVCPHEDSDDCECRKPAPGMLTELAARWDVELGASYMVGDSWKDVEAGRQAGCTTILLRRSYNAGATGDHMVESLAQAVEVVLQDVGCAGENGRPAHGYAERYLAEARHILDALDTRAIETMAEGLATLRERGGRLFVLGVGGGAGHASHAVGDFRKIAGIESYAVSDNASELTARINDEGWETSYREYLRASRLRQGDGVFVFSVGGGSPELGISVNLVHALAHAREVGASIFGVVGRDGGYTARVADHCILVPTASADTVTAHTEGFQALLWHLLVSHPRLQRGAMKWESVVEAAK